MRRGQKVSMDGPAKGAAMGIKVIVADDHPLIRSGIRWAIHDARHGMKMAGEADKGQEVLALARKYPGAVYLVDIGMPDMDGLKTARRLLMRDPTAKIIFLGLHDNGDVIPKAFRIGVRGYLAQDSAPGEVREAIARVSAGEYYLSTRVLTHVARKEVALTGREREVLRFIVKGWSGREIAVKLKRSIHTVHAHRANLMAKVGLHKKEDLIRYAQRAGLVEMA